MSQCAVEVKLSASKELEALPDNVLARAVRKLESLADNPLALHSPRPAAPDQLLDFVTAQAGEITWNGMFQAACRDSEFKRVLRARKIQ